MAIQERNQEMANLLGADLQKRYESGFAWRTACSMNQALTGLRGFWPMSNVGSAGAQYDLSGQNRILTYNGNPAYSFDGLAPYIRFDGAGDFLSRGDEAGLDILGTEAFIAAGHRGLTLGGWFRPENAAANQVLMSKWSAAPGQYSYILYLAGAVGGDPVRFSISDDGTNADDVSSVTGYDTSEWQFFAGRFNDADAGAELAVWNNDEMTTAATARAAIFNSNTAFCIGAQPAAVSPYTGKASLCFLCAAALADATVWAIYQQTRALFKA